MSEQPVPSPCVNICALDDDDVCVGCYRSLNEITQWHRLSNAERQEVWVRCQERAEGRGYGF